MSARTIIEKGSLRAMLRAVFCWFAASLALVLIAALILWKSGSYSGSSGYASSAVSFLAAVFAGAALRRYGKGSVTEALIGTAALVLALMTLGCFISAGSLDSSAIISVCSFTTIGCLIGYIFTKRKQKENGTKHYHFHFLKKK